MEFQVFEYLWKQGQQLILIHENIKQFNNDWLIKDSRTSTESITNTSQIFSSIFLQEYFSPHSSAKFSNTHKNHLENTSYTELNNSVKQLKTTCST